MLPDPLHVKIPDDMTDFIMSNFNNRVKEGIPETLGILVVDVSVKNSAGGTTVTPCHVDRDYIITVRKVLVEVMGDAFKVRKCVAAVSIRNYDVFDGDPVLENENVIGHLDTLHNFGNNFFLGQDVVWIRDSHIFFADVISKVPHKVTKATL